MASDISPASTCTYKAREGGEPEGKGEQRIPHSHEEVQDPDCGGLKYYSVSLLRLSFLLRPRFCSLSAAWSLPGSASSCPKEPAGA